MTSKEWGVAVWALFHAQPSVVPVATIEAIIADLAAAEARVAALREYCSHEISCPLAQWSRGRPTKDGGYETMYDGKWYQGDDKPACTCGLDAALAPAPVSGEGKVLTVTGSATWRPAGHWQTPDGERLYTEAEAAALRADAWVRSSEALPVVVKEKDGSVNCVLIYAKDRFVCGSDIQVWNAVYAHDHPDMYTHWRPLPPAPEVKG